MQTLGNFLALAGATMAIVIAILYASEPRLSNVNISIEYTDAGLLFAVVCVLLGALLHRVANDYNTSGSGQSKTILFLVAVVLITSFSFFAAGLSAQNSPQKVITGFHKLYHQSHGFASKFLGIEILQYPSDAWVMQEIITELKPDFIVETGTWKGGGALFYATILEKVNKNGKVITVDINPHDPKVADLDIWKERVEFIAGSSVAGEIVEKIRNRVWGHKVLVTLDSLHWGRHVLKELQVYSPLVSINSYIVVQDTQFSGHPITGGTDGPWEAVHEFLKTNKNFAVDRSRERHLVTANPSGFLKRIQ